MSQTLPDKDLAALQRRFKRGYTVEKQQNGHFRVVDPDGGYVLKPGKGTFISLPGTPSSTSLKAWEHDLTAAGVLRTTPAKRSRNRNGGVTPTEARRIAWEA